MERKQKNYDWMCPLWLYAEAWWMVESSRKCLHRLRMKYVIIFVLSTTGVEEIKLKTHGLNCGELANAWREVNTRYYEGPNQGNFTPDGKLMIGYYCEWKDGDRDTLNESPKLILNIIIQNEVLLLLRLEISLNPRGTRIVRNVGALRWRGKRSGKLCFYMLNLWKDSTQKVMEDSVVIVISLGPILHARNTQGSLNTTNEAPNIRRILR